jgi:RES domain-containing protein
MGEAWRIVKLKHAATAFDGEGARLNGGRWNSVGVRVVYVSFAKSLAALETLVHLKLPVTSKYVGIPLHFDDALVETFAANALPGGWDAEPPSLISQQIGDAWVKGARSALLALPSVITRETNFLINPAHPGFGKIKIGKPEPFTFDPRLLGLKKP